MNIGVKHIIAHIALSRSGGTHQPATDISNILVDIGGSYAMTRSVPKSFAASLISSAFKAIAKLRILVYWIKKRKMLKTYYFFPNQMNARHYI